MDKKVRNLDDWQAVVDQVMDTEAKAAWQTPLLAWESDAYYFSGHRLLHNEEFKDQKDSEIKKNDPSTNNNSRSRKGGQAGQASTWSFKKDSHLNKEGQQG